MEPLSTLKCVILKDCHDMVKNKMEELDAGKDHGIGHIIKVMTNSRLGIESSEFKDSLSDKQILSILLAALLHEVDDRKLTSTDNYENARIILRSLAEKFPGNIEIELIIRMVDLVSCSKNGNYCPDDIPIWMLFPRAADRLEAIGKIGTQRCIEYSRKVGTPLYVHDTPLSVNRDEIMKIANPTRFDNYVKHGGHSVSSIDHHYDKLLHINRPDLPEILASSYFMKKSARAHEETIDELIVLIKKALDEKSAMK